MVSLSQFFLSKKSNRRVVNDRRLVIHPLVVPRVPLRLRPEQCRPPRGPVARELATRHVSRNVRVVEASAEGFRSVPFEGRVDEVARRGAAEDAAAEGGGVVLEDAALDVAD